MDGGNSALTASNESPGNSVERTPTVLLDATETDASASVSNQWLSRVVLVVPSKHDATRLSIMRGLTPVELICCMPTCKAWAVAAVSDSLWLPVIQRTFGIRTRLEASDILQGKPTKTVSVVKKRVVIQKAHGGSFGVKFREGRYHEACKTDTVAALASGHSGISGLHVGDEVLEVNGQPVKRLVAFGHRPQSKTEPIFNTAHLIAQIADRKVVLTVVSLHGISKDDADWDCGSDVPAQPVFYDALKKWHTICSAATTLVVCPTIQGPMIFSGEKGAIDVRLVNGCRVCPTHAHQHPAAFACNGVERRGITLTPRRNALHMGRGDFTFEVWVRLPRKLGKNGVGFHYNIFSGTEWRKKHEVSVFFRQLYHDPTGMVFAPHDADQTNTETKAYLAMCDDGFHHLAIVRHKGMLRLFHDGRCVREAVLDKDVALCSAGRTVIMGGCDFNDCTYKPEDISSFRIDKGAARYWGPFVPDPHLARRGIGRAGNLWDS